MADSLVTVASNLTPVEGELARLRLAHHGVAGYLGSTDLLTWLWHYTVACHGVALQVASSDASRAREILSPVAEPTDPAQPAWRCPQCGEVMESDWDVCWRCGTSAVGELDEQFLIETITPPTLIGYLAGIQYLGAFCMAAALVVVKWPLMIVLFTVSLAVQLGRNKRGPEEVPFRPEADAAAPASVPTTDVGDEICRRAMAAAMFGYGWFSPLCLYSLWLLSETFLHEVSPQGHRWRLVAGLMILTTIGLLISMLLMSGA